MTNTTKQTSLENSINRLQKLIDGGKNDTLSEATAKLKQARFLLNNIK